MGTQAKDAPIRFECEECGRKISAPASAAGGEGTCPQCGEVLIIPDQSTRKESKGGQTRMVKAPGPRRGGGGRRRRRGGGPEGGRPPAIEPWQIVLLVIAVVGILGTLIFALVSGGGKSSDDDQPVAKKKVERTEEPATEEPAAQPDAKKPDGEKKPPAKKKPPKKKRPKKPKGDPVKPIPYTAQADTSKQLEGKLVALDPSEQRELAKKLRALPMKVALPILLNAFRQLDLKSQEGAGNGTFIHQLLIEISQMEQDAPHYTPVGSAASRETARRAWFTWYWTKYAK